MLFAAQAEQLALAVRLFRGPGPRGERGNALAVHAAPVLQESGVGRNPASAGRAPRSGSGPATSRACRHSAAWPDVGGAAARGLGCGGAGGGG
eukprot:6218628-Alexandrium_andersonii.AAC.1